MAHGAYLFSYDFTMATTGAMGVISAIHIIAVGVVGFIGDLRSRRSVFLIPLMVIQKQKGAELPLRLI